jgi:hypothetical protein
MNIETGIRPLAVGLMKVEHLIRMRLVPSG